MTRKKKICKECGKERYIFSKGRCEYCASKSYTPRKKKKTTPKRKKRKSNRKKLSDKLTQTFNRYIRKRNADENGMVYCITSGKRFHYKDLDAGHFITATKAILRWDERNVFPQSRYDNRSLSGRYKRYREVLVEVFGEEFVANMEKEAFEVWIPSENTLRKLLKTYTAKLKRVRVSKYIGKKFGPVTVLFYDPTNPNKRICKVRGKHQSLYLKQIKEYGNI